MGEGVSDARAVMPFAWVPWDQASDSGSRPLGPISRRFPTLAIFARPDGRTLHVRQATQPEAGQRAIYEVLGIHPKPGGVMKTIV